VRKKKKSPHPADGGNSGSKKEVLFPFLHPVEKGGETRRRVDAAVAVPTTKKGKKRMACVYSDQKNEREGGGSGLHIPLRAPGVRGERPVFSLLLGGGIGVGEKEGV